MLYDVQMNYISPGLWRAGAMCIAWIIIIIVQYGTDRDDTASLKATWAVTKVVTGGVCSTVGSSGYCQCNVTPSSPRLPEP